MLDNKQPAVSCYGIGQDVQNGCRPFIAVVVEAVTDVVHESRYCIMSALIAAMAHLQKTLRFRMPLTFHWLLLVKIDCHQLHPYSPF